MDTAFPQVIAACAKIPRRHESGTWILSDMIEAYCALHEAGFAHSVETLLDGELVGGLYGVSIGRMFFGESMFSHRTDASKIATGCPFCRVMLTDGLTALGNRRRLDRDLVAALDRRDGLRAIARRARDAGGDRRGAGVPCGGVVGRIRAARLWRSRQRRAAGFAA